VTGDQRWMGLQKVFPFSLPTRIEFGPGVARRVGEEAAAFGRRALVVTDHGVREAGVIDPLFGDLRRCGLEYFEFADVEANPRVATVEKAAAVAVEHGADVVVAVGGGSVLDTAKVAAAIASHGGGVFDYEGSDKVPGPVIPVLALPTTSGTGSEVTCWAVITDESRHYKMAVGSPHLAPRVALVDPALTVTVPPAMTAGTGSDALSHAVEAYTARCSSPMSDALALYAIELVGLTLERAVNDGSDLEARCGMAMASLAAGIALGNADTSAGHAMAEALGGVFDTPHGLACGICLPWVLRLNLPAVEEKTARIGQALGLSTSPLSTRAGAEAGVDEVAALLKRVGIPSLRSLGVTRDDIPRLVSNAVLNLGNPDNPVDVDGEVFTSLFEEALADA